MNIVWVSCWWAVDEVVDWLKDVQKKTKGSAEPYIWYLVREGINTLVNTHDGAVRSSVKRGVDQPSVVTIVKPAPDIIDESTKQPVANPSRTITSQVAIKNTIFDSWKVMVHGVKVCLGDMTKSDLSFVLTNNEAAREGAEKNLTFYGALAAKVTTKPVKDTFTVSEVETLRNDIWEQADVA